MRTKKAFTLVELLIVIAIIGILTAILTFSFMEAQKRTRDTKRKSDLKTIQVAFEAYKTQKGKYPLQCSNTITRGINIGFQKIDSDGFGCLADGSIHDLIVSNYISSAPIDPKPYTDENGGVVGGYYLHTTDITGRDFKIISYHPELLSEDADCQSIAGEYYDPAAPCTDYQVSSNSEATKTW